MKILCLLAGVAIIGTTAVLAQGTVPSPNPATPSPPAAGSTGMDRGAGTGASAKPGSSVAMARADGAFVRDAAAANKAEVALGTLAQTNSGSAAVKDFGHKMIEDHTNAYEQLARIAAGKGVPVPTEPSAAQKRIADKLSKLTGPAFDKEFATVMVDDHKKAVSLFRKEANGGADPDLKSLAAKTVPTLEHHLTMAQQLQTDVKRGK